MNRFDALPHIAARHRRRQARYAAGGHWSHGTLKQAFERALRRQPDQSWTFLLDGATSRTEFGVLGGHAVEFGRALAGRPAGAGHPVVAIALPNCPGAVGAFHGAQLADRVAFPLSMRESQESLASLLATVGVEHLVVGAADELRLSWARGYRNRGLVGEVWLADPDGRLRPDAAADAPLASGQAAGAEFAATADGVHLISYTSGSTAEPKIVLHTDAQLLAESRSLKRVFDAWSTILVASPVGHITGILHLLTLPLLRPAAVVSMDRWDAAVAVGLIREHGVECTAGTPLYYQDLERLAPDLGGLRGGIAGGGPVAPAIVQRLDAAIGAKLVRSYGSTEHPTISQSLPADELTARAGTDGRLCDGVEVKLADPLGEAVSPGEPGEILSRGPDAMAGYLDPELDAACYDDDDWLRTGDVGVLDDAGRLTIADRVKDIVIRGGENISAKEVEDRVHEWDAIDEAVVVGVPDERYGERACVFVRAHRPVDLDELRAHLAAVGLEKYKWPEYLVAVEDLPRTPSGKVSKRLLRQTYSTLWSAS